jgi:hypothetical protein
MHRLYKIIQLSTYYRFLGGRHDRFELPARVIFGAYLTGLATS